MIATAAFYHFTSAPADINPSSVYTLSALGSLERKAGDLDTAETYLTRALEIDARHTPSLKEMSLVRKARRAERVGEGAGEGSKPPPAGKLAGN